MIKVTVAICTHNPIQANLERTLSALKAQSLDFNLWELILVDNASEPSITSRYDLQWHRHAKQLYEARVGLTHARIAAISQCKTDLLLFVDDDNVLDRNYVELALDLSVQFPFLGAWGGRLIGEFEVPPPEWSKPYLHMLALREVPEVRWSNIPDWSVNTCPVGAGMVVRRAVAEAYVSRCNSEPTRLELDRKGKSLAGCGDLDLAFTACELGLGTGLFPQLALTHIIPRQRLTEEYFLRLQEGNAFSLAILDFLRFGKIPHHTSNSVVKQPWLRSGLRALKKSFKKPPKDFQSKMQHAWTIGRNKAATEMRSILDRDPIRLRNFASANA